MSIKRTSILISGAAALAFLAMMGTPAEAFVVTANTDNPGPVTPLDLNAFPTGSTNIGAIPGTNITSINFAGGDASLSGVYAGNQSAAKTPFPNGTPGVSPPDSTDHYLVAEK